MSDEDKTFSGSFVLDLRIWWRQAHTLYYQLIIKIAISEKKKSSQVMKNGENSH